MEPGKLSMGFPSHKYLTIFYFPLGDRAFYSCILVLSFTFTVSIIVLYCIVSYSQSDLHTYFPIYVHSLYVSQRLTER